MDYSQQQELSEDMQLLSKFGKLLSHPIKINIITLISQNGNKLLVSQVNSLEYSTKSIEKHLKESINIGLIYIDKNEHNESIYSIDLEVYSQLRELFEKFINVTWRYLSIKKTTMIIEPKQVESIIPKKIKRKKIIEKDLLSFIKSS